ncbi:MAG: ChbG/HpnK family deacetylase [Treponema sp.]|jgi:hypothetical protein|nr:ChbG/HpnK family deacetylase [Treponema sp.]
MGKVRFITRADDAGSSHSANRAIRAVLRAGFIKNVSVMAPGRFLEEAADLLAGRRDVCFGMHAVLNAEWDRVKWGPVSALGPDSGLVDGEGAFLADPRDFERTRPRVETVMGEYNAQLDKLCRAGFDIRYVDTHMLPERFIPGLDEALRDWAAAKGLLDHMYYYRLPPGFEALQGRPGKILEFLRTIPPGQYFFLAHPARYGPEMLQTGNSEHGGEEIARARDREARLLGNPFINIVMGALGIVSIRYDQAEKGPRLSLAELPIR